MNTTQLRTNSTGPVSLPLSSRQVLGGGGTSLDLGVSCPRRGHYTPIATCVACEACEGIIVGDNATDNAVLCAPETASALSPAPARSAPVRAEDVVVAAIMTPHVFCVRSDVAAERLASLLVERHIGSVPVVDALGRPIGVASRADVIRWVTQRTPTARMATVADVMTPVPFSVPANESVAKAAALMAFEHLQALPVVAPSGQVIGIVSSHDVLAWVARGSGYAIESNA